MSDIHFTSSGEGKVIVLLHGFCETHHIWKEFASELSPDLKVLCPDLPGFGDSLLHLKHFSLEDIADQLEQWLQGQGIANCTMIGHSMGGYITLIMAKKYPDLFDKIGLFHSVIFADDNEKKNMRNKTIDFIGKRGLDYFVDNFFSNLFYEKNLHLPAISKALKDISERAKLSKKDHVVGYLAAMRDRSDSADWIKNYQKHVLFISGLYDTAVPVEKSRAQVRLAKLATQLELEEAGHMGMFEQTKSTLAIIKDFMKIHT